MSKTYHISFDDIEDADAPVVARPRTISKDIMSRKNFRERRAFERFDDATTKVENPIPMAALVNGRAA